MPATPDIEIAGVFKGFHVEGKAIMVEPGEQARLTLVFDVKRETKLEEWLLLIADEAPQPLKVTEVAP
jgi:hypothetical protein